MNKYLAVLLTIMTSLLSAAASAAPGEYWEITSKMEMAGMPFAMPATTTKVCIAKGAKNDPRNTTGDKDCKMSDIKSVGKKTSFKVRCDHDGEVMTGTGEFTATANSTESKMHFSGKDMDINMTASSKRIGGSCDSEEANKKMQAMVKENEKQSKRQTDMMCDTSKFTTSSWIDSADLFIGSHPVCPGKKETLCQALRNDVPHDVNAFEKLVQVEQAHKNEAFSPAKVCKLNLNGMKKSLCKAKARSGPRHFLEANCPAEAKIFRELMRKREACEGRGYTSGAELKQCMGGDMFEEDTGNGSSAKAKSETSKSKSSEDSDEENSTSTNVLEGAKKLKGLFGF